MDYSQVCIANYMQAAGNFGGMPVDIEIVRHMVLKSLSVLNNKFRSEYGEMVIAVDDNNSWRKESFPYYKANRKKARSESDIDWTALFQALATVKEEIIQYMPYKVVQVKRAEADDIIAWLSRHCVNAQIPCLIVSGDHDFIQLQIDNIFVKQYDTKHDRWISHDEPRRYLFEHVIKGDLGDGVPNVYSLDDHYVTKACRAPRVTAKKLEEMWANGIGELAESPHFKRNVTMIDLRRTPEEIKREIRDTFFGLPDKDKSQVLDYFIKFGLRKLAQSLGDF